MRHVATTLYTLGLSASFIAASPATLEFAPPAPLPVVNGPNMDHAPWLTPDELTLYFSSDRPGGNGGADIWVAVRPAPAAEFDAPVNVTELNSNTFDGKLAHSPDGLSVAFVSDREGGQGGSDIWAAQRSELDGAFAAPSNLAALNSPAHEVDVTFSSDGRELFFSSACTGTFDLYRSLRPCQ